MYSQCRFKSIILLPTLAGTYLQAILQCGLSPGGCCFTPEAQETDLDLSFPLSSLGSSQAGRFAFRAGRLHMTNEKSFHRNFTVNTKMPVNVLFYLKLS